MKLKFGKKNNIFKIIYNDMKYIKSYQLFEKRVPRSERLEIYRDSNIIVVAPPNNRSSSKICYGVSMVYKF